MSTLTVSTCDSNAVAADSKIENFGKCAPNGIAADGKMKLNACIIVKMCNNSNHNNRYNSSHNTRKSRKFLNTADPLNGQMKCDGARSSDDNTVVVVQNYLRYAVYRCSEYSSPSMWLLKMQRKNEKSNWRFVSVFFFVCFVSSFLFIFISMEQAANWLA